MVILTGWLGLGARARGPGARGRRRSCRRTRRRSPTRSRGSWPHPCRAAWRSAPRTMKCPWVVHQRSALPSFCHAREAQAWGSMYAWCTGLRVELALDDRRRRRRNRPPDRPGRTPPSSPRWRAWSGGGLHADWVIMPSWRSGAHRPSWTSMTSMTWGSTSYSTSMSASASLAMAIRWWRRPRRRRAPRRAPSPGPSRYG